MPLPDGDAYRITAIFSGEQVPTGAVCTTEFRATSAFEPGLTEPVRAAYYALHAGLSTSHVTLSELLIKRGPEDTGPSQIVGVNSPGTQTSDASAPNVATLIRKELALFSGRLSGRWFWPGTPDEGLAPDGTWSGTWLADLQGFVDTWFDDMNAAGLVPVIYGTGDVTRTCSAFTVQQRVATMRKRLRR